MTRTLFATPSYRNDHDLIAELCESVDRHVKGDYEHFIVVPQSDIGMFRHFQSAHRRILSKESLVGERGYLRLPLPSRLRIPCILDKKIHEQWWKPGVGRVNGWLMQQMIKICIPDITDTETIVYLDSDVVFFRDFDPAMLWQHDKLHLQEHRAGADLETHRSWRRTARRLLGITEQGPADGALNYIGMAIPWRRSTLMAMRRRIEQTQGCRWIDAIAGNTDFSEYITYGLFCREVLRENSGHVASDAGLYCSIWTGDGSLDVDALARTIKPSNVALHIQSTIRLPMERRRELFAAARERFMENVK